ncbi:MAG: hypothetical protein K6B44_02525 [Lachnospiraceae bacterium]|nr:hypothetical protein [Lachnospiraceae bacterium]
MPNVVYSLIAIFWICSLQKEISDKYIRYCLQAGGILLVLLFVLRYLRWDLVPEGTVGYRMIWYAYYISFIGLPGLSLAVSVFIGSKKKNRAFMHFIATSCILLILLVLTNDLHRAVMMVEERNGTEYCIYRPLYYFIIAWYSVMLITSLVLVLYKCRLHVERKLWWVPPVFGIPGFIMWGVYFALGGTSPSIAGINLYNIQEVYLLVFIGMWESCIMVGLVPSRSLSREREWIREGILDSIKNEFAEMKKIHAGFKPEAKTEFTEELK